MLRDHSREKLINAIAYFSERTNYCGKTKLFKLLYFLDFEHFAAVGRSVTALRYFAWPMGPVPVELFEEINDPESDLHHFLEISSKQLRGGAEMLQVSSRGGFDPTHFSRRELGLMERLATEFRDAKADDMVEATHLENLPWHEVYEVQRKRQQEIPYELAIRASERDEVGHDARDHEEFRTNYE